MSTDSYYKITKSTCEQFLKSLLFHTLDKDPHCVLPCPVTVLFSYLRHNFCSYPWLVSCLFLSYLKQIGHRPPDRKSLRIYSQTKICYRDAKINNNKRTCLTIFGNSILYLFSMVPLFGWTRYFLSFQSLLNKWPYECNIGLGNGICKWEKEKVISPLLLHLFLFVVYHYSVAGELLYGYLPNGKRKGNIIDSFQRGS